MVVPKLIARIPPIIAARDPIPMLRKKLIPYPIPLLLLCVKSAIIVLQIGWLLKYVIPRHKLQKISKNPLE